MWKILHALSRVSITTRWFVKARGCLAISGPEHSSLLATGVLSLRNVVGESPEHELVAPVCVKLFWIGDVE